ncbi:hypothetical protein R5R35_002278 [Gryllus longicercus]|uniref:Uncharacterized protein n=1 Tax=Gryllus longicercus TaxID=2509291 RepID=A0AAN9VVC5_9ORTH
MLANGSLGKSEGYNTCSLCYDCGPPDVPFLVAVDVTGTNSVNVRFHEPEQQDSAICTKFKE